MALFSEKKFDFDSGSEKIEVKSSSNFERIHTFSSEQLNPEVGSQVLIASVSVKKNYTGQSILQLMDSITNRIQNELELVNKLNTIVSRTLGNLIEESLEVKFDYQIAKDSIRYFRHQDIIKIEKI